MIVSPMSGYNGQSAASLSLMKVGSTTNGDECNRGRVQADSKSGVPKPLTSGMVKI